MTKKLFSLVLALSLTFLSVAIATAGVSDPADTYVDVNNSSTSMGDTDSTNLWAASSGAGLCNPTRTTYLRWNLAGTETEVGADAKLALNARTVVPGSSGSLAGTAPHSSS